MKNIHTAHNVHSQYFDLTKGNIIKWDYLKELLHYDMLVMAIREGLAHQHSMKPDQADYRPPANGKTTPLL